MELLNHYAHKFAHLNANKNTKHWTVETQYYAPHKPLLLLSVIDLFAEGQIKNNFIELAPDLGELFTLYWSKIFSSARRKGNILLPFWHMRSEGFWHILPKPGHENYIETATRIDSISKFEQTVLGAKLDDKLYQLLQIESGRESLRHVLLSTYFVPQFQKLLLEQGTVNLKAFEYGQELLKNVKENKQIKESTTTEYAVRSQGFKTAVRQAYDHHCAMTGLRIVTMDGHSAVIAAHIIPWSETHNDDPRNGIALSHTCHWAFDEGLLTITDDYHIKLSPQLNAGSNVPKYLLSLDKQPILAPPDDAFWPSKESLKWHRSERFRKR